MPTPSRPNDPLVSQFANDPEMAELVQFFVTELPARIEAMNTAWAGRNVDYLTRLAHQLKGASAGYGFPSIRSAAAAPERRLRSLVAQSGQQAVDSLAADFRELVDLCARACKKG